MYRCLCPFGRVEKLVLDEQLDLVALLQNIVLLGALAIDFYFFSPNELIHQRRRQALYRLGKKLIKSLPRIVAFNLQNLHLLQTSYTNNGGHAVLHCYDC